MNRVWAVGLLLCVGSLPLAAVAGAQTDQTSEAQLLGKAHALAMRGRMDLAKQVWQQVLNSDPGQPDALAGMARANKLEGHPAEAQKYLDKLRTVNPSDPDLPRIESMGTAQDESSKLQEAGRLAQAGQYARAMAILRDVYGTNPPPGDPALSYYETEAATEDGRPHAVAGLRALIDKYPQDSRYQVALGKILTYNPRTRAEGRKLLARHPYDPEAQQAMRQSLDWDQQRPAGRPEIGTSQINGFAERQNDAQVASSPAIEQPRTRQTRRRSAARPVSGMLLSPAEQRASRASVRSRTAEQRAAYKALNAKRILEAERLFNALLEKNPKDFQAAAGLGYVRMNQFKFDAAITFFERAEEDGDRDPAIERALRDSRFYFTMQTATTALNDNNLAVAEQEFRAALRMRPNDPTALQGLGGTFLKGQQNDRAVEVFATLVRVAPGDDAGWRGLFMAQYGAAQYSYALETDRRIPAKVKAALLRDPDYLRTLASVYMALGRDAEAQRVLRTALDLPFPAGGAGLKVDVELQFAALLSAAGHKEQAIALYKQVLAQSPKNVGAWVGLVQNEHQLGRDAAAFENIRTMPSDSYKGAMQEAGFETTVAAVYEAQGHDELAQEVLEQFLANEQAQGKRLFAPAEIQLAGIYLRHGDSVRAYSLYRSLIEADGRNADAWSGLLGALHATGHDREALAQLQSIPPDVRQSLENNPGYLQTVGSIYASLGDSRQALEFLARSEQHYGTSHTRPPAEMDVQTAWLLYNSHSDQELLRHLLVLGERNDLTDQQRLTVQTLWADFAVRRANQASAAGNYRLALAILNAAAQSFPTNQDVIRALAGGYASAGNPREAVEIFKSQDLNKGSAGDYRGAVGAALAANDLHDAEIWLRFGLDQYPGDPQMMVLAARFEAARGDPNRAGEYYRAALSAMPPANPGAQLISGMVQPVPVPAGNGQQPRGLAALLAEPSTGARPTADMRPYLPSFNGGTGGMPAPASGGYGYPNSGMPGYGPQTMPSMAPAGAPAPSMGPGIGYQPAPGVNGAAGEPDLGGYPANVPVAQPSGAPAGKSQNPAPTLNQYNPHSRVDSIGTHEAVVQAASAAAALHLHADKRVEATLGPYIAYDPSGAVPHFVGSWTELGDGVLMSAAAGTPTTTARMSSAVAEVRRGGNAWLHTVRFAPPQEAADKPAKLVHRSHTPRRSVRKSGSASRRTKQQTSARSEQRQAQAVGPAAFQATPMFSPRPNATAPAATAAVAAADGTPVAPYAATAYPVAGASARRRTVTLEPNPAVRERAAAIRENQESAPALMTGVSRPPVEAYEPAQAATLNNVQYNAYDAARQQGQMSQPAAQQGAYSTSAPQYGPPQYGTPPPQNGGSGQQYPQPGVAGNPGTSRGSGKRRHGKTAHPTEQQQPLAPPAPAPGPQQPPMQYPIVPQPLDNLGAPIPGGAYPLGQAPTDYQLQQRNLPPLRGYYDPRGGIQRPMSEREQAEFDLAQIEGSYSSWAGASVIGRYRSGTPGIDRLAALKVPVEATFAVDNSFRLSIIPEAVFLNSGTLNTNGGALGTGPVLGTYLGTAPNNPSQQFANGIGVEVQLTTNTLAAAIGTTPFQFLVTNLIGRGQWRPGNSHFLLYGGRDPVEETQLSYAGLRDPGTATATYGGNVWGGVVATGGGVRFDYGDARSGFYVQGEGAALTGYHVLQNQKADGLVGAYFRVKNWPQAGTLNIGGTFYGMHFTYNERGETYGLGGYFSPEAYFLAAVPLTFTGHYGTDLHYSINGSLGVQTFQEDNETYFPLDPGLLAIAGCTNAQFINHSCGLPVNSNTGLNFSVDSQVSYKVADNWYVGGFLSANNTNNYDTVTGGFFARYTFRPQYPSADYPTGLFPVRGFRPLRVP